MINMDNSNGLTSTGPNASATSTELFQSQGQDFKILRNISTKWDLFDISGVNEVDTFVSTEPIYNGDALYIVKNDLSIHKLNASLIGDVQNEVMISNNSPSNIISDINANSNAYLAFDNNEATNVQYSLVNDFIVHVFDTPQVISDFFIKCDVDYSITSLQIEGSTDGISYATISVISGDNQIDIVNGKTFTIQSSGLFTHYKFVITSLNNNNLVKINTIKLLSNVSNSVDTSSITVGEIPNKVFKFTDVIKLNNSYLVSNNDTTILDTDKLLVNIDYDDMQIDNTSIITTIEINTIGNSFKEIVGVLYK